MIWEYSYFRKPPYQTSKMIKHEIVLTFYLGIFVFGIEVSTWRVSFFIILLPLILSHEQKTHKNGNRVFLLIELSLKCLAYFVW